MKSEPKDAIDSIIKYTGKFSKETERFKKLKENTELPAKAVGAAAGLAWKLRQLKETANVVRTFRQNMERNFELTGSILGGAAALDVGVPLLLYTAGAATNASRALGDHFFTIGSKLDNQDLEAFQYLQSTRPAQNFRNTITSYSVLPKATKGTGLNPYTQSLMDFGEGENSKIRIPISTLKWCLDNKDKTDT
jgi:hypothetical protein